MTLERMNDHTCDRKQIIVCAGARDLSFEAYTASIPERASPYRSALRRSAEGLRALLFRFVSLFLLTLSFVRSGDVAEQTTSTCGPPSCEDSRLFQMALLTYPANSGLNWKDTAAYEDVSVFTSDNTNLQPPGRSIMLHQQWLTVPVSSLDVDWSRILAIVIDEPYVTSLDEAGFTDEDYRASRPCSGTPLNEQRRVNVDDTRGMLMDAVNLVHEIAPRTRVWVNFHEYEVNWMRDDCATPLDLNFPAIDVVSLDKYLVDFSDIDDAYDWFVSEWPQQQLALVPATAYRNSDDSPQAVADRLQGYFAYAESMNAQCDMGLGRVGRTGNYDGCRVWIVAGWLSTPSFALHGGWHSLLWAGDSQFPSGAPILDKWVAQLSKLRRTGGTRTLSDADRGVVLQSLE